MSPRPSVLSEKFACFHLVDFSGKIAILFGMNFSDVTLGPGIGGEYAARRRIARDLWLKHSNFTGPILDLQEYCVMILRFDFTLFCLCRYQVNCS